MNESGLQSIETLPLIPLRDMRVIEGEFQTILEQGKTDPKADDYVFIRLTDKQALLDPMNRLREVYPNTLQLEKIGMLGISETRSPQDRVAKHGEFELFKDFFQQIQGQPLNPDQEKAVKATITAIHKKEK
jgi:exonuclease SbcD